MNNGMIESGRNQQFGAPNNANTKLVTRKIGGYNLKDSLSVFLNIGFSFYS